MHGKPNEEPCEGMSPPDAPAHWISQSSAWTHPTAANPLGCIGDSETAAVWSKVLAVVGCVGALAAMTDEVEYISRPPTTCHYLCRAGAATRVTSAQIHAG